MAVLCETRQLAEEWTYRYLAAAHAWAGTEAASLQRLTPMTSRITGLAAANELARAPQAPEPSTAEVRAWARDSNITVPGRGKLRPEIWDAWRAAQQAHQQAGQEG